jgi:peptide/nickel transport system permease protein
MRLLDVLLAFPSILLAVGIAAALGPGIANLMIALVVVGIPSIARIVRATVLQIRELEYVLAARALGASHGRVLARQVVPNVLAPVIVFSTLETGRKIILAAGLSFLGLGVLPPTPDWGAMLASGRQVMLSAPHVATIPGLLIFIVTLAFNVLGDGLRDALDPRLRNL